MSSTKFWIIINVVWALSVVATVYIISNYWIDSNTKIAQLIESGVPSAEVKCAMEGYYSGVSPICILASTTKAPKHIKQID